MKNFIEELYYGNIYPQAKGFKKESLIQKELALLSENEKILTERLSGEEKELFLDYVNTWGVVWGTSDLESFMDGFRLGARLFVDVFMGESASLENYLRE